MKRLLILFLPLLVLLLPAPMRGQGQRRAGLVVQFSDGSVRTSCVEFAEEQITGLQLLQRSGLEVIAQTGGGSAAVCKIGPDGCNFPAEPCFCKFGGGQQGQYWAFWRLASEGWQYSNIGAGSAPVANGDVQGWAWGVGSVQTGAQPPLVSFEQACPVAARPAPTDPPLPPPATAPPTPKPDPPTTVPTQRPAPSRTPTVLIVARAPGATTEAPATEEPTTEPTATSEPTATIEATATGEPPRSPTSDPTQTVAAVAPTSSPIAAGGASSDAPTTNPASYVAFGVMFVAVLSAIGVALRRRR